MCAAITDVDKQRFPFSDVQRVCFSEIANHAKINGAKDVPLIAGNIFCKAVQMHSVFTSACSYAGDRCAFIKGRRTHDERMTNARPTRCLLGSSVERMAPNPRRSTRRRRENAGASTLRARSACFGMRVRRPPARR